MNNDLMRRQSVIELIDDLMKSPYANSPQFGSERRECMDLIGRKKTMNHANRARNVSISQAMRRIDRMSISEQVKELRELANSREFEMHEPVTYGFYGKIKSKLFKAADTIESLSTKFQAANMECQKGNYSLGDLSELIEKFDNEKIKGITDFEQVQIFNALIRKQFLNYWVCKINCVNYHRLFDTPIFLSLKIFSTKLCIIGRNWQTIFLEVNDYVTGF